MRRKAAHLWTVSVNLSHASDRGNKCMSQNRVMELENLGEKLSLLNRPRPGRRVRRVPHRFTSGGRRSERAIATDRPRPQNRWTGGGHWHWCRSGRGGKPGRFTWLGYTCGECGFCRAGRENLCPSARFTGYQIDGGGYSDYTLVDQRYRFPIHRHYDDTAAAPSRGAMERNSLSLPRGCRFGQPCGSEG